MVEDEGFKEILAAANRYFASDRDAALFAMALNGIRIIMLRDWDSGRDPSSPAHKHYLTSQGKARA